ncbi:G-TYPE LECTIN S-RECEPTOR-LIKE SERINE/THREONINE-PROTEIN KINASE [Salix koriyanagi]|uniref:G-TYPE LECTIN S-RECEPTOR-LIKE SERINE/THREONINE-PROTEIN KINASE n=1 Tax=Salix koriyanagi TaxID=2511006 RepID=A0A9Q0W2S8_9ROSI|nr:G-TYPE LECTIN S-RECEPTOR-LIKE SERINE/THREONINE-PROTEIN KINASE [Salix koriyanagi]
MGVRYSPSLQSVSYPINSMKRNLDWAHVVAYDYHVPSSENFTGNHAALYNPSNNISTDFGIREWLSGGYPASKLVLGPSDHSFKIMVMEQVRTKISYAKEKGLLGYNVYQVINDDNWALSLAAQDEVRQGKRSWLWLKIVLPIALISILLASLMFYYRSRIFERKAAGTRVLGDNSLSGRGTSLSAAAENFDSDAPALQVFSFESIKAATNNFSSENQLGKGGFGPVYKVLYG